MVLRARTVATSACLAACLNLINSYCAPIMIAPTGANWGISGIAFFFAGTTFLGLIGVYFLVP